jgi:RHS repeat-associated protein
LLTAASTLTARHVYARALSAATITHCVAGSLFEKDVPSGATKKNYRFGGRLVAVRDSASGLHYLDQDHLGTTSLQTSSSGAYEGHEFRGPFGQPWAAGGALATDFQYTDQRSFEVAQDSAPALGSLYFYGSRWYSPVLGRFLQPDTIVPGAGNPQSMNRYNFVGNNPLRYRDPTGNRECEPCGDTAWDGRGVHGSTRQ